jgi:flagellar biosynthesis protein FlhB
MSNHVGEKTEQATPKHLEEALKKGQFARSPEVQTLFVLMAGFLALKFTGPELWNRLVTAQVSILGHLHEFTLTTDAMQRYAIDSALTFAACAGPIVVAVLLGGLLAGGIQSRFQTASEALSTDWERVNPVAGLQRLFSMRSGVQALLSLLKLGVIGGLSYAEVRSVLEDPIFNSAVDVARIAGFLAESSLRIGLRVGFAIAVLAAIDYGYQLWRTQRDLMMTKEEVKEELKNSEGNPHMKARQRRRRQSKSFRQMLAEVPKADVIVTNPTHIAIALRYDRKTMKAPKIVAKGTRLNALKIREIAGQHQIPIIENKPLARMMFKYGKVGGEIPAQLYAAVAEVLAWVYGVNRYRYYAEQNAA